jgi:hypothetical protein
MVSAVQSRRRFLSRASALEDTLRFHALRLHEVGMIKTSPQKLIVRVPTGGSSTS